MIWSWTEKAEAGLALAERAVLALERIADALAEVYIPAEGPGNDGTGARAAALRTRETTR